MAVIQTRSEEQPVPTWPRAHLKDLVVFRSGHRNSETAVLDGEFPFFVCSSEVLRCNEFDFDNEAVIMAGNNADGVFHLHHFNGRFAARQRTYVITPDATRLDCRFLFYQLEGLQRSFQVAAIGTTTRYVTLEMLRRAEISLPDLAIQRALSETLSDVDGLLGRLQALIAKKRAIKQAAMQQLLTGKTRLPGFSGEWETRRVSEIAPLQRGFDLPTRQVKTGPFPVVYSNGVLNYHDHAMVKAPGVVTGRSGTIGRVHYVEVDFWPHNTSLWVTSFRSNVPRFVFYLYTYLEFERFLSGSGVPTLNRNDVHQYVAACPPPAEQQAIATVLSDMDAEIEALEQRRDKTRAIKQGMMQQLLTGRIRLVKPPQAAASA